MRSAVVQDAAVIAELALQLEHGPGDTGLVQAGLGKILSSSDATVFVYTVEERVVGWLHVFHIHRLGSTPFAEIAAMVVDSTQRRQGAGAALVEAARGWTQQQGLAKLRVRTNELRQEAPVFYKALGFVNVKSQNVMDLPVKTS